MPGNESTETSTESTETAGTDTETGTDTSEPSELGGLARGLRITEVLVNQGVAVAVADAGAWVDGASRNARLIGGRPSLVQVRFDSDPSTEAREIEVWLVLEHPTLELEPLIATAAAGTDARVEVDFALDPELGHTDPGVGFRVELHELVDAPPVEGELDVPVSPSEGTNVVGFEALELVPEIVLVPIHGAGEPVPELDADGFREHLMAWMPATRIELSVHEPVELELDDMMASGFGPLTMLSEQEQASPDVSYIGVVYDPAGEYDQTALGSGHVAPNPQEVRVGMLALVDDELLDAERLAWLLYNHSTMQHVECPGTERFGTDPNYPHAEGKIGVWGWDMATGQMFDPAETYDLATWCEPRWVSDYTWSKALESLRITTAW